MSKKSLITLFIILLICSLTVLIKSHEDYLLLQGEVDTPEIIVTSKAKGRVIKRLVERGDTVKTGQVLMELRSPELVAQLHALEAARDQAKWQLKQSNNGTRKETIANLKAQVSNSQAVYDNAQEDYLRKLHIAHQGYVSPAELDNARQARDSAFQQLQGARANLLEGEHGDRKEQRAMYEAQLRQAEQDLLEFQAQTQELQVRSPVDGEVGPIPVEVGQLTTAYSPLLTLLQQSNAYFVFNLRENILAHVRKGDEIVLRVPALNDQLITARIGYIAPLGDYATKSATRATGDFDLKTFEVRLYPLKAVAGLRQGMSALWRWQE